MVTSPPSAVRPARARRWAVGPAVAATSLALVAAALPAPEPAGLGDRLFPRLGNPGYDVQAYDISFRYGGDNTRPLQARTRLDARVTDGTMGRFNLDFAAGEVRSVRVNGRPAQHTRAEQDLVVTPEEPLRAGTTFRVEVEHSSVPKGRGSGGWLRTKDGLAMANQPDGAHRIFPANDHPSDKAAFTFHVTAPRKFTVVAGGLPVAKERSGGGLTWTYHHAHPMAPELAQLSIGRSEVLHRRGPHGLPMRDVIPRGTRKALEPWLKRSPEQVAWMERKVGPYPFETYGLLVGDAATGFELETQTLSLFEKRVFTTRSVPAWYKDALMVHELAHQWFGNSVTPEHWSDLWLNEGHATWYEWLYGQRSGGPSLAERAREAYEQSDRWRGKYGPPAALRGGKNGKRPSLFSPVVYDGSAVVLFALRQKIGTGAFTRLQRAWVAENRDGNASTRDFTALASRVSGQDLSGFLRGWLYDEKTPRMPGHPNWHSA